MDDINTFDFGSFQKPTTADLNTERGSKRRKLV